jgi:hypothetical protein
MQDIAVRLEKLRKDAAECELLRDLAIDKRKRELFGKLADQLNMLATEVERTIAATHALDTFLGRKIKEPFAKGKT